MELKTNYVLIDYENVQVKSLTRLKGDQFSVRVFLGPHNRRLPVDLVLAVQELGSRADYIQLETPGANALDFHIAYHLGALTTADPSGFFHIISRDAGFDPLVKHLRARKILCSRSTSIEEMPCFASVSTNNDAGSGGEHQTTLKSSSIITVQPLLVSASGPKSPPLRIAPTVASGGRSERINHARVPIDELIKVAVSDLAKRKTSRPGSLKALLSTVHATCGKQIPLPEIQALIDILVSRGYVRINGTKVSYKLPSG